MSLSLYIRGSAVFMASRLSGAALSFALTPVVLGVLGPEQYGLWAILGSAVGYVSMFDMGLSQSFTRFLAEKRVAAPDDAARIFYFGIFFYSALALILVPAAALIGRQFVEWFGFPAELSETAYWAFIVMVGYFSVTNLAALGRSALDAMQRVDIGQSLSLLGVVLYWTLGVVFIFWGWDVWGLVAAAIFGQVAVGVAGFTVIRRLWPDLLHYRGLLSWSEAKRLLGFGAGLQVGASATTINLETDRLIIGKFVSLEAVTGYELGNMVAKMVRVLPLAFLHSALPIVTNLEASGRGGLVREQLEKASRAYSGFGFFLAGGMACMAPLIMSAWLGTPQPGSAAVLAILAPGWAFVSATGVATTVMRARGKVRVEAVFTSSMAALNLAATLVLVRPFGAMGVVAGTSVGAVVASVLFLNLFCGREGLSFRSYITQVVGRPLLATGVAVIFVAVLSALLGVGAGTDGRMSSLTYLIPLSLIYFLVWLASALVVRVYEFGDFRLGVSRLAEKIARTNER